MDDLTNKTIMVGDKSYYVYAQLVFNFKSYILVDDNEENPIIYELINKSEKYYINNSIDNSVIEKFIKFLSIQED